MSVITRKNAETMPQKEWNRFVSALNEFKAGGGYDLKTQHHAQAMRTLTLFPDETGTMRNVAHRGPAFFPWHRQALRELELTLIDIQKDLFPFANPVGIPYWRWNVNTTNWQNSGIWQRVGGNGVSSQGWKINTGPFAGWTSTIIRNNGFASRPGIVRQFNTRAMPSWGTTSIYTFDAEPWNENSTNSESFRRFFEVKHNAVHINVGGDMLAPTSPNDPLFWLHHCNVDRAWARWQSARGIFNYQPNGEGPIGHNVGDAPSLLDSSSHDPPKIIDEMLDPDNIDMPGEGFAYDTLLP